MSFVPILSFRKSKKKKTKTKNLTNQTKKTPAYEFQEKKNDLLRHPKYY